MANSQPLIALAALPLVGARLDRATAEWLGQHKMHWIPEDLLEDFRDVARLAGITLTANDITIEALPAPHRPPTKLPPGKMAVYVFSRGDAVLKIGKVGLKSQARYTSQHYIPGSVMSTLAGSLLADKEYAGPNPENIGGWIRDNVDRINFVIDGRLGVPALTLLESFLQCRLNPRYEGFRSQKVP